MPIAVHKTIQRWLTPAILTLAALALTAGGWQMMRARPVAQVRPKSAHDHEEQTQPPPRVMDIPEVELGEPPLKAGHAQMPPGKERVGFADPEPAPAQPTGMQKPPPVIDFPAPSTPPPPPPEVKKPLILNATPAGPTQQGGGAPAVPAPSNTLHFGPRLPLIGDPVIANLGNPPVPSAADLETQRKYVHGVIDPANTFDVIQGRTRLLVLKGVPKRIQLANDGIVSWSTTGGSDLTLAGQHVGATVLNLWFPAVEDKTKDTVISYLVRVAPDPDARFRLERAFKALEQEINAALPGSRIQLKLAGDAILVAGATHDVRDTERVLKIVAANAPGNGPSKVVNLIHADGEQLHAVQQHQLEQTCRALERELAAAFPDSRVKLRAVGDTMLVTGDVPHRREATQILQIAGGKDAKVIDRLHVAGAEQIMLKVVVAEVNRTVAQRQGTKLHLPNHSCVDRGQCLHALHLLKRASCAKALAEPNLVTLDGQAAKFEVGGQLIVPASGAGAAPTVVPYGVQIAFTPIIVDQGRIRLQASANVSSRDSHHATLLGLSTRSFASTLELSEGETLSVAGLIQTHGDAPRTRLPFLRPAADETEVVILVTPEFVRPTASSPAAPASVPITPMSMPRTPQQARPMPAGPVERQL